MINEYSRAIHKFYHRLHYNKKIQENALYHSDVYFVRWGIWERTGVWYTLDHVRAALWLEGYLHPNDLKKLPEEYVEKYYKGVEPDMVELTAKVTAIWRIRQAAIFDALIEEAFPLDIGVPSKV